MNPVKIGNATLYLGDCIEILPALPKVDAVITDGIISHEKSTNRQYQTQHGSGNSVGVEARGNTASLPSGRVFSGEACGALRGGAASNIQGIEAARNQSQVARPQGEGKRAICSRHGEYALSQDGEERLLQCLRECGESLCSSQGRKSPEQQEGEPGGSLLALPYKPSQKRVVGRKERIALITDPPYGIRGKDATSRHDAANGWGQYGVLEWDLERPSKEVFDAMLQASDVQVIWGGNYFADYLPVSQQWLSWDKGQDGFSLADFELAWSSQDKACRRINYPRSLALKDGKQHPTQKPLAVMRWCIEQVKPDCQTILDPFMGSGTTGVAAIQLGRSFIGIERDPAYFAIACKRIEQAVAQGQLFAPEPPKQIQEALL